MSDNAYLAGLRLTGKKVVVVGGGTVAQRRLPLLIANGADVYVITRSATPAGEASSRMRSTSSRLPRWVEGGASAGTSPPRYTTRSTPARAAAVANCSAARRSRSENESLPASIEWIRK